MIICDCDCNFNGGRVLRCEVVRTLSVASLSQDSPGAGATQQSAEARPSAQPDTAEGAVNQPNGLQTRQAMDRPSSLDTATHQGNSYDLRPGSLGLVRLIGTSPSKRRKPISKPGQVGLVSFGGRLG